MTITNNVYTLLSYSYKLLLDTICLVIIIFGNADIATKIQGVVQIAPRQGDARQGDVSFVLQF